MIEVLLEAERAMSFGLLDQAERLYRQAAESDPRNSIAVVGLARVAIERGNDTAAYGLGMAALEIDPDNQAARRLVDRLTEVMIERGDAVPGAPIERGDAVPDAPIERGDAVPDAPIERGDAVPGGDAVPDAPIERGAGRAEPPLPSPPRRLRASIPPASSPQPAQPAPPAPPASTPGRTPITRRRLKRTGLIGRLFGRRS